MVLQFKMSIHTVLSLVICYYVLTGTTVMSCPASCTCAGAPWYTVNCQYRRLTMVPGGIPNTTITLFLDINQIQNLSDGVFSGLPNLRELYLESNQIQNIGDGVFSGLPNLQALGLNNNQIRNLSDGVFSGLPNLPFLRLNNNQIRNLSDGVFSGLPNLRSLWLHNNQIQTVSDGVFSGLPNLEFLLFKSNPLILTPSLYVNLYGIGTISTLSCIGCVIVDARVAVYLSQVSKSCAPGHFQKFNNKGSADYYCRCNESVPVIAPNCSSPGYTCLENGQFPICFGYTKCEKAGSTYMCTCEDELSLNQSYCHIAEDCQNTVEGCGNGNCTMEYSPESRINKIFNQPSNPKNGIDSTDFISAENTMLSVKCKTGFLNDQSAIQSTMNCQFPGTWTTLRADPCRLPFNCSDSPCHPTRQICVENERGGFICNYAKNYSTDVCGAEITYGGSRGNFSWPDTSANETKRLVCPVGLDNNTMRFATRQCVSKPSTMTLNMASWGAADITNCPTPSTAMLQALSKIDYNSSEPEYLLNSSLAITIITNNTKLTSDDIDFASLAISKIVEAVSSDELFNQTIGRQIALSTFDTVNFILDVKTNETVVATSPARRITKAMEGIVTSLTVDPDEVFQVQKSNIGIAISCPKEIATDQVFRSETDNGTFYVGNEIILADDDNLTGVAVVIAGSTLSTATKLSSFGNDSLCNVASTRYILYKTQTLFRDTNLSNDTSVDSQIISVQVGKEPLDNLKDPNVISFDILSGKSADSNGEAKCVFWDFDTYDGEGGWSDQDCTTSRSGVMGRRIVCRCNHLTNFAVLFTRKDSTEEPLKYISIIGSGLSMIGLLGTMFLILGIQKLRRSFHYQMIFGLCTTLLMFLALFTVILYYEHLEKNDDLCRGLAMATHYLLLCAFMWMSVDATILYKSLVIVFHQPGRRQRLLLIISVFALPLIITGISAGITQMDMYGYKQVCWIKADMAFYGSLVAPMSISLLYNIGVLITVVHTMRARNKNIQSTNAGSAKSVSILTITVSLSVLLGLTWIFGFLVLIHDHIAFQYIFTILNSLEGFAIFLHIVRGEEAWKVISGLFSSTKRSTGKRATRRVQQPLAASSNLDQMHKESANPGTQISTLSGRSGKTNAVASQDQSGKRRSTDFSSVPTSSIPSLANDSNWFLRSPSTDKDGKLFLSDDAQRATEESIQMIHLGENRDWPLMFVIPNNPETRLEACANTEEEE